MSFLFAVSADPIPNGNEGSFFDGVTDGGGLSVGATNGPNSRRAFGSNTSGSDYGTCDFANRGGTVVDPDTIFFQLRVATKTASLSGEGTCLFQVYDGTTVQVSIVVNSDWTISAWRGSTSANILGTSTYVIPNGWNASYHTIRGKIRVHNSSGTVEIRVDGNDTPVLNLSSQNTRASATAQVTKCTFKGTATGSLDVWWTDCAVWSSAGSDGWTDWKAPLAFPYYAANADDSVSGNWTPSTGATHFGTVDDATWNAADYNASATVNAEDKLGVVNTAGVIGTIHAVIPMVMAHTPDAGGNTLGVGLDISGTSVYGSNQTMTGSGKMYQNAQSTKPGGGSWAASDVDNARICYKVTT